MIDLSVKDLVKSFDADTNLLDGVSFDIQAGERVGLLGRNGAGKTTLFKILTGELDYNTGEVRFAPGRKVGLISQIPHYPAGYTVEDVLRTAFRELANIQSKMRRLEEQMAAQPDKALLAEYDALSTRFQTGGGYETDMQTDKICNGLGIPAAQRQQDFDSLSGGEKTRVNLARLLLEKTDILLLDEPTNHLDMHAVEWLEGYIEKFRGTVLTISHDRYFLDRVVTRIIELHDGKAEFYSGNYSFYVREKQARFDLQLKQYEKEQAKLGQLGFTLERMKGWGINNRTLYRRAMSIQHRMERIEKTDRPTQEKTLRARFAQRDFFGDEVLSVKGLGKAYDGRTLFSDVELQVAGGERIALLGDNGTGKSTFLKLLLGEEAGAGRVKFGPTVKWAYLPQIIHFAHPERTLLDTMLYEKNCSVQTARDRLGAYLFEGEDVFKTVSSLSGGEQSRLRLCMLMDEKINLLVLDENGLRMRWRTTRGRSSSCPTTAILSTNSPRGSGSLKTGISGTSRADMKNTVPSRKRRPSRLPRRKSPKRSARKNRRPPAVRYWKSKSVRWNVRLKSKSSFPLSWIRRLKPPHPIIRNLRG